MVSRCAEWTCLRNRSRASFDIWTFGTALAKQAGLCCFHASIVSFSTMTCSINYIVIYIGLEPLKRRYFFIPSDWGVFIMVFLIYLLGWKTLQGRLLSQSPENDASRLWHHSNLSPWGGNWPADGVVWPWLQVPGDFFVYGYFKTCCWGLWMCFGGFTKLVWFYFHLETISYRFYLYIHKCRSKSYKDE